jgi:inner membrane protein
MDPITHGITGALLGKGFFSDRQGRVATFAATLGAVFPDIDFVAEVASRDPMAIVKYHRGITHSFVALPFFAAALAWLTRLLAKRRGIETPSWPILTVIYGVGIASHILLDGTTSFGTRMWTPISQKRVAWDLMFIIDFILSSCVLLPQVVAWVYNSEARERSLSNSRATKMWGLFSVAAVFVWVVALFTGYPFHLWIVALASAVLAALFFLPGIGGWGVAHRAALARVQHFAQENQVAVARIGALPIPPSLLDWGDVIRTPNGVYQSRFDLRTAESPAFYFVADSPPDAFVTRALRLPEVQLYWQFSRFPTIRTSVEGSDHIVDFSEHRFTNGNRRTPQPFSYRVIFDDAGNVVAEGWLQTGMFTRMMMQMQKPPAREITP